MIAEDALRPWEPIELAQEPDFSLGAARVRPSLTEFWFGDRSVRLQPRVMQVMVALHQAGGEVVSRDELIARCWGGLAVGEDSITRCMAALRRLADTDAKGAFAVETIPRVGYRLIITLGAEDSEAGALGEADARPIGQRRSVWPLTIGVSLGACALALGATWLLAPRANEADVALTSLVVGTDPDAKSVGAALPDLMAGLYAKSGVKTLTLPNDHHNIDGAAQFLLRGQIEGEGDRLNATITVADPIRGEVLWTTEHERPRAEAGVLGHEIASHAAGVTWCALEYLKHARRDAGADLSRLMLKLCDAEMFMGNEPGRAARIRQAASETVGRYPDFAPGLVALAENSGGTAASDSNGRTLAERALKLDPRYGRAWLALERLLPEGARPEERYQLLARGLAISPDDPALNVRMSEMLDSVGFTSDAFVYARKAVELAPLDPITVTQLQGVLQFRGSVGGSRALSDIWSVQWPDDLAVSPSVGRVATEAREGDPDQALALVDQAARRGWAWYNPDFARRMRRIALTRKQGTRAAVERAAQEILSDFKHQQIEANQAFLDLATIGAVDQAYALAAAAPPAEIDSASLFRPPETALRADHRFMPLAARLGLVAFWRARGRWPDFCQAPDAPYDCAKAAASL